MEPVKRTPPRRSAQPAPPPADPGARRAWCASLLFLDFRRQTLAVGASQFAASFVRRKARDLTARGSPEQTCLGLADRRCVFLTSRHQKLLELTPPNVVGEVNCGRAFLICDRASSGF